ncbi:MAG: Lipid A export ATP-binding/permease protein MsbA [Candidatus Carbobacillus altaicus]|uniref:Lipid A export ATP-binding/permease protein MsbA n=1 Tax=Candidatus Carbonibacillus altaicus TaxID=2163959 RepID=A0A2R6XXL6_9BACL|nr:MAG: Lipid A export ATP-binding/permease protein MsbA [Candidatus Carbobacillus altaicus]
MSLLLRLLKPDRFWIVLIIGLTLSATIMELLLPTLLATIVDHGIVRGDVPYILKIGAVMLGITFLELAFSVASGFLSSRVAAKFGRNVRQLLFQHVLKMPQQDIQTFGTATLITRATNDITQVQQMLLMSLRMMVRAPLMAIGGVVMAISMDRSLSLVLLGTVPLLILVIAWVLRRALPLFKKMQKRLDGLNRIVRQYLNGVRVIRAFAREKDEKRAIDAMSEKVMQTSIQVNVLMASMMPLMMLIMNVSMVAILWVGAVRIEGGALQVGSLMAFIQYAMLILGALMMMTMIVFMLPRASVSMGRIAEVLALNALAHPYGEGQHDMLPAEIDGLGSSRPAPAVRFDRSGMGDGPYRFRFESVTFRYPGAERAVLEDVSFTIEPGEVTAIIGGTGSGKSTLLHLLLRFYEVTGGQITLDGKDIREIPVEALRARIGYVPQQTFLFSGTIFENIAYGYEGATRKDVQKAAEVAQADAFIQKLPDGYDTYVDRGGKNLSGGQKQRLAIARAVVRPAALYIFDDSFSALDYRTDLALRQALKAHLAHTTQLWVAQRTSTIREADKIIVLEHGRIAGIGTHDMLLQTSQVYQEIVQSQSQVSSA